MMGKDKDVRRVATSHQCRSASWYKGDTKQVLKIKIYKAAKGLPVDGKLHNNQYG